MDIFAHGLWAGAVYKVANKKSKKPLNIVWAVFWGVFPDLFAFAIPFVWTLYGIYTGTMSFGEWPRPERAEPPANFKQLSLAHQLYNFSHSIFIFAIVFFIVWLFWRRPRWELGGWLLHILIDIPTHTYKFFPTPVFWPLFGWKFDGVSWGTPWFMIINYSAVVLVYYSLYRKRFRRR